MTFVFWAFTGFPHSLPQAFLGGAQTIAAIPNATSHLLNLQYNENKRPIHRYRRYR